MFISTGKSLVDNTKFFYALMRQLFRKNEGAVITQLLKEPIGFNMNARGKTDG
jgi:hypothetical protein